MSITGDYSPGDVLGEKYTIIETIGRGSNGVTYKVTSHTDFMNVLKSHPYCHLQDVLLDSRHLLINTAGIAFLN